MRPISETITVKIKRKDICRMLSYEHWLLKNLNRKQKVAFRKYTSYFDASDFEKELKAVSLINEKSKNVISYFGTNERFRIRASRRLLMNCIYGVWSMKESDAKFDRKDCIKTCYKYLRANSKHSHYKCTALSNAIAYEFDLKHEDLIKTPLQKYYNNTDVLWETAKSITASLKKKSAD